MHIRRRIAVGALFVVLLISRIPAQTHGEPEEFTAVTIMNNNLGSGAGTVQISVDRWSNEAERNRLGTILREKGPDTFLKALQDTPRVGRIRTPDSMGYELRYAQQTKTEDGGRRIVIITDRPISFWEARERPRTMITMSDSPGM